MTILNIKQANRGAEIFGMQTGEAIFPDHETACFWFATAKDGRQIKISKHTMRLCHWRTQSTSPVFEVVEFEPAADPNAWIAEDAERIARNRAKKAQK